MSEQKTMIPVRVDIETWRMLKKASFYGEISMNKIVVDAIEARRKFIETKYLRGVDRNK